MLQQFDRFIGFSDSAVNFRYRDDDGRTFEGITGFGQKFARVMCFADCVFRPSKPCIRLPQENSAPGGIHIG